MADPVSPDGKFRLNAIQIRSRDWVVARLDCGLFDSFRRTGDQPGEAAILVVRVSVLPDTRSGYATLGAGVGRRVDSVRMRRNSL